MERFRLIQGDCLEVLKALPDNSVDSIVMDPPSGIGFMGREWDTDKGGRVAWVAWFSSVMAECRRVLKPGGHGCVWALPRTSHWTATATEEATFEVREVLTHHFGQGFAKGLDIAKAFDKAAGVERKVIGPNPTWREAKRTNRILGQVDGGSAQFLTEAVTEEAKRWEGWGTLIKPATEHWILCRKPLEGTVIENIRKWGVGGLHIDACRIATDDKLERRLGRSTVSASGWSSESRSEVAGKDGGRYPPNLLLSHAQGCMYAGELPVFEFASAGEDWVCVPGCPIKALDDQTGVLKSGNLDPHHRRGENKNAYGASNNASPSQHFGGDEGGASRFFPTFFYEAKPSVREKDAGARDLYWRRDKDRASGVAPIDFVEWVQLGHEEKRQLEAGNKVSLRARGNIHPTVKSIDLMEWLVALVTPPGGLVLDCFMGSGSTGVAIALADQHWSFVGIERDPDYYRVAKARVDHAVEVAKLSPAPAPAPPETPTPQAEPGAKVGSLDLKQFERAVRKGARR